MKRNGFISITIIYTFFIVIMLTLLFVILTYSNKRISEGVLAESIKNEFKDSLFYESIPDTYKRLSYIQSSGTQYINTGILLTPGYEIDFTFTPVSVNSNYQFIFGSRYSNVNTVVVQAAFKDTGGYVFYDDKDTAEHGLGFGALNTSTKYTIIAKDGSQTITGSTNEGTDKLENYTTTDALYLFARNVQGHVNGTSSIKLYSCVIYKDGALYRNYVPVLRTSDSKPGLYDTVDGVFYTNQGSGDFTYFSNGNYLEIEYIQSDGKQFIKPGINVQDGLDVTLYVKEWKRSENSNDLYFIYNGTDYKNFTGLQGTKDSGAYYIGTNGSSTKKTGITDTYNDTYFRYQISGSTINYVLGGVSGSIANTASYPSGSILLLGRGNSPTNSYIKCTGIKIYLGSTLVRDLVPAVRISLGKPGLYDKVNNVFYTNQGTGEFIYE